jgi:tetratricopeptide (TPR) repeat protein
VEGSGQKYGNAFRLRMQLIMADHESHLWGESFQQNINDVKDIFYVQTRIAESVAGALKAVITPEEKKLIEKVPTADQAAFDSYLRGLFCMTRLGQEDVATALHYFEEARTRDPRFAQAYAGISAVWLTRQQLGWAAPEEAGPKIVEAVERALELDSTLADVHNAVASLKVYGMFDLEGGEAAFKKAIEINPNHADAHATYSHLLNMLGRTDEAMAHINLALSLDPYNTLIKMFYSQDLLYARRYDEAISVSRDIYEKNPSMKNALDCVYHASHVTGRYDHAFEAIKLVYSKELGDLVHVFDRFEELGYAGTLKLEADTLLAQAGSKYIAPTYLYDLYTFAADKKRALDMMESAYEVRDPNVLYIGRPSYSILSDEPRYRELLRKLNLSTPHN